MPLYSSVGIAYDWGTTIFHGGTVYYTLISPFDHAEILRIIDHEKINHLTLVPIMLDFILAFLEAEPGKYDGSYIRTRISAGAPTWPKTREKAVWLFGDVLYVEYSATEMGVATCLKPHEVLTYPFSCGRTALGQEIKIIDLNGADLPRDEVGEICVAGSMVTRG